MTKRTTPPIDLDQIDIDELLRRRRQIAHIWSIEGVLEVRPDLSDDQAWTVLQACDRDLDSAEGLSWDAIEEMADELFPLSSTGGRP